MSGVAQILPFRAPPGPSAIVSSDPPAGYVARNLNVLVVEDDAADFQLIDRSLRQMPWFEAQITLAGSLLAARLSAAADDFDVIVLDHCLNGDTSTEFARHVAKSKNAPAIVLVSSLMTTEIEYEAITLGVAACMSKDDITPRVMENTLRQALQGRATRDSLSAALAEAHRPAKTPARTPTKTPTNPPVTKPFGIAPAGAVVAMPQYRPQFDLQELLLERVRSGHPNIDSLASGVQLSLEDRPIYISGNRDLIAGAIDGCIDVPDPDTVSGGHPVLIRLRSTRNDVCIEIDQPTASPKASNRLQKMAEAIVEAHGGRIEWASSTDRRVATIVLPLARRAR